MASSDGTPSAKAETAEEPMADASSTQEVDKTVLSTPEERNDLSVESNGGPADDGDARSPEDEGGDEEDTLESATELFEKGSKAIEDGDFVEAVDCLSRALEIR